ncbi:ribosomal RNA small subunit methyltransferase B [Tepiditoga spiralis]|uniref:Ribosomal RNA small subunit methyltransferase B n=1 Tax=Tepiditoga spiralis TaxID=2108365 RepID=A0A7G1G3R3_9BACT|nr:transcription antitermination factor NusB [Tepiditoga spiralis]BBE31088.1 ribosomal RNA small subunit methyltransferase B [Tepiditoga spiralis]
MVRSIAFKILKKFDKRYKVSIEDINIAKDILNDLQIRELKGMVWGTIRNLTKIDYILSKFVKNFNKNTPASKTILRLGVYQLLAGYDEHAVVYETVELAKNKKLKGFINAVLRKCIREIESMEFPENIKYSYPKWIYDYIKKNYSFYKEILEKHIYPSNLVLRVNTLKTNRKELSKLLQDKKWDVAETIHSSYAIEVLNLNEVPEYSNEYKNGYFYIQNESSQLVPIIMNPNENDMILDMCSAPGGKTTFISQLMNNKGKIIALDNDFDRISMVSENIKRLGILNTSTELISASEYKSSIKFDKILMDVPCSSIGTSSIHPEVILRTNKKDTLNYQKIQREIIKNSFNLIKKDGKVIYSTCTIFKEENTDNMKWISKNYNVEFIDFSKELKNMNVKYYYDGYGYYIIPDDTLIPFYICKYKVR